MRTLIRACCLTNWSTGMVTLSSNSQNEQVNLLFIYLFTVGYVFSSTAEAVLQEMDNISSIRQNRELERLRMWSGDTEEVSVILVLYETNANYKHARALSNKRVC